MKKLSKPFICIFITIVTVISILPMSAFAASYRVDYWNFSNSSRTLSVGYNGNDVRWLQSAINNLIINGDRSGYHRINNSYKLDVDGVFGNATKKAVIEFQRRYSLAQDGKFGPASRSKMRSVLIPHSTSQPDSGPTYSAVSRNVSDGVYYIRNKRSNKYLDVNGGTSYNGAQIIQHSFHGGLNQQFRIKYESNGYYKIYPMDDESKCLDLRSANEANSNGTDLWVYDASFEYQEQNFRFSKRSDDTVEIGSVNSNGNKVLEVTDSSYDDCAVVQIWDRCDSRDNDNWYLEPVNDRRTSINKVRQAQMNVKSKHMYDSIDDAALDFIMAYDGMSVAQNREYGSGIVKVGDKYTFNYIVWGPVRTGPSGELGEDNWDKINSRDAVAYVHTHGQVWNGEKANLVFSPSDMNVVDNSDHLQYAYLGNANGEVYKYVKGETDSRHTYEEFRANSNKYSGHKLSVDYAMYVKNYWTDTSLSQNNNPGIYDSDNNNP